MYTGWIGSLKRLQLTLIILLLRQHRKTRNQVHYDMSQSNEEEHYFSDDQQFDFVPAPLETYQSYNSYDPDMLAALPETSISRTVPDDIAETVISRRR